MKGLRVEVSLNNTDFVVLVFIEGIKQILVTM